VDILTKLDSNNQVSCDGTSTIIMSIFNLNSWECSLLAHSFFFIFFFFLPSFSHVTKKEKYEFNGGWLTVQNCHIN